jgi:hypothetical protein
MNKNTLKMLIKVFLFVFRPVPLFLLGIHVGLEVLGHMPGAQLTSLETSKHFSTVDVTFYAHICNILLHYLFISSS